MGWTSPHKNHHFEGIILLSHFFLLHPSWANPVVSSPHDYGSIRIIQPLGDEQSWNKKHSTVWLMFSFSWVLRGLRCLTMMILSSAAADVGSILGWDLLWMGVRMLGFQRQNDEMTQGFCKLLEVFQEPILYYIYTYIQPKPSRIKQNTLWQTNIAMGNPPFEDVFPFKNGDFPLLC